MKSSTSWLDLAAIASRFDLNCELLTKFALMRMERFDVRQQTLARHHAREKRTGLQLPARQALELVRAYCTFYELAVPGAVATMEVPGRSVAGLATEHGYNIQKLSLFAVEQRDLFGIQVVPTYDTGEAYVGVDFHVPEDQFHKFVEAFCASQQLPVPQEFRPRKGRRVAPVHYQGLDFYPAVEFNAPKHDVEMSINVHYNAQVPGVSCIAPSRILGIGVLLCQLPGQPENEWLACVHLPDALEQDLKPTEAGAVFAAAFTRTPPTWVNHDLDDSLFTRA